MGQDNGFNPDFHLGNLLDIVQKVNKEDPSIRYLIKPVNPVRIDDLDLPFCLFEENSGRLVFSSRNAQELFGYQDSELADYTDSLPTFPGFSDRSITHDIASSVAIRGMWQGKVKYFKKSDEELWLKTFISTFEDESAGTIWMVLYIPLES